MKKHALLSSILVIALCLTLIVGSTFALFTASDDVTVAVDAGRVEIFAGLSDLVLYSVEPDADGEEFDEHGKPYTYMPQTNGEFLNKGTATLDEANGIINLVNITPGDKVTFKLNSVNDSDVDVQYRYKIECVEGYKLMGGMTVTVNDIKYPSMAAYTSGWNTLDVNEEMTAVELALELPVSAGNEFKEQSAKVKLSVEVVQANADVSDTDYPDNDPFVQYITSVTNGVELASKLASDDYLHIFIDRDIDNVPAIVFDLTNKTIDANGNDVALTFGDKTTPVKLDNVVVKNIYDTADETPAVTITNNVSGDITVTDSVLYSGSNAPYGAIAANGSATTLDLTVERCAMFAGTGETVDGKPVVVKERGLYLTNADNLTVRNCSFVGFGTWPIMVNGTVAGNIVVSDCTFDTCTGIMKTSIAGGENWQTGSLNGNFTFANNTMVNCSLNNCSALKMDCYISARNIYGALTFSNNTMNGVIVTPDHMLGIRKVTNP